MAKYNAAPKDEYPGYQPHAGRSSFLSSLRIAAPVREGVKEVAMSDQTRQRIQGKLVLQSEPDGDAHAVRLFGELDLASAGLLDEELQRVEATDVPRIVLDLKGLEFIDSTGLNLIIKSSDRTEGRMALLRGSQRVQRTFELCALDGRLRFLD
jgi:anti-anti-sigma factor